MGKVGLVRSVSNLIEYHKERSAPLFCCYLANKLDGKWAAEDSKIKRLSGLIRVFAEFCNWLFYFVLIYYLR